MKASRNKTIDISVEEGKEYLRRCIRLSSPVEMAAVLDRTIIGNSLEVMPLLPRGFVDLAIIDPPYNLSKDFGGNKFSAMSDAAYEEYTESWLRALLPLLKDTASVYVCCDWQSSSAISRVLGEKTVLLDGGEGTARETKRRLAEAGLLRTAGTGEVIIENSAADEALIRLSHQLLEL